MIPVADTVCLTMSLWLLYHHDFLISPLSCDTLASRKVFFQLLERRAGLLDKAGRRRTVLEESYRLQQFERDCDEMVSWINEKLKTARDDSYLDPTNIQGKIQKHANFEQELQARVLRVYFFVSL